MTLRRTLLRGAAALSLAAAIIGTTSPAPAAASPLDTLSPNDATVYRFAIPDNDNEDGEGGIGDVPIIGDVVGGFQDAPPEEIVSGAIDFAGMAAETVIPLIRGFIK